mmetsp:Transcript_13546/g.47216  ORF Transcript_13546/g.47216 Transcript_13546/m.47216 type:complete len:225 (+) Transcript_13546:342-1016(+)
MPAALDKQGREARARRAHDGGQHLHGDFRAADVQYLQQRRRRAHVGDVLRLEAGAPGEMQLAQLWPRPRLVVPHGRARQVQNPQRRHRPTLEHTDRSWPQNATVGAGEVERLQLRARGRDRGQLPCGGQAARAQAQRPQRRQPRQRLHLLRPQLVVRHGQPLQRGAVRRHGAQQLPPVRLLDAIQVEALQSRARCSDEGIGGTHAGERQVDPLQLRPQRLRQRG